jgi:hypothetical protein
MTNNMPPPVTINTPPSTLIPDDDDSDTEAERMDKNGEETSASEPNKAITEEGTNNEEDSRREAVQKATAKQSRMNRELKKLDSSFIPTGMERQLIIETDEEGNETDKEVHFVFLVGSEHGAPKTIQDAIYGPEREKWTELAATEIMNFISQKCWKKVPRRKPRNMKRKIMRTK